MSFDSALVAGLMLLALLLLLLVALRRRIGRGTGREEAEDQPSSVGPERAS